MISSKRTYVDNFFINCCNDIEVLENRLKEAPNANNIDS